MSGERTQRFASGEELLPNLFALFRAQYGRLSSPESGDLKKDRLVRNGEIQTLDSKNQASGLKPLTYRCPDSGDSRR